jgi:hypothetical protein
MSERERFFFRKTAEYDSVLEIVSFQLLGKGPKEFVRLVEEASFRVTYYESVIPKTAKYLGDLAYAEFGVRR